MSQKYYLSGIDWAIAALDFASRRINGQSNCSHLLLRLSSQIKIEQVEQKIQEFIKFYPWISGKIKRDFNFCPYWKIVVPGPNIRVETFVCHDSEKAWQTIVEYVNDRLNYDRLDYLIGFRYIPFDVNESFIVFKFDHKLLDAQGAEKFLTLVERYLQTCQAPFIDLVQNHGLDLWQEKFIAGQKINRFFLNMRAKSSPAKLSCLSGKSSSVDFKIIIFNQDETKIILDKAQNTAGYFMLMPYFLSVCAAAWKDVFRITSTDDLVVPVNINTRVKDDVFFNHLSFLFFKFGAKGDFLSQAKNQWYEQVKNNIPQAIEKASMLARILPLSLTYKIMEKFLGADTAAFSFAYLDKSAYDSDSFADAPVKSLVHLPVVPPKPGVGIFFTRHKQCLNMTISYAENKATSGQMEQLASLINEKLRM